MAFVFDNINQQLQEGQGNIFQAQAGSGQTQTPQQGTPGSVQLGQEGGGVPGESGASPKVRSSQDKESKQAALNLNVGQPQQALESVQQRAQKSFGEAQQAQQQQAQQIAQSGPQVKDYNQQDVQKAFGAGGNVAELSSFLQQKPEQQQFQQIQAQMPGQDFQALQTAEGRQALLRKEADQPAQYTRGMAALDELLLRRSPEYQQTMEQMQGQQEQLAASGQELQSQAQSQAQAQYEKNLAAEQADVRNMLQTYRDQIQQQATDRGTQLRGEQEAALAAQRAELEGGIRGRTSGLQQQLQDLRSARASDSLKNVMSGVATDYSDIDALDQELAAMDPGSYLQQVGGYGQGYATPEQVSQYNQINQLLGLQDQEALMPEEAIRPEYRLAEERLNPQIAALEARIRDAQRASARQAAAQQQGSALQTAGIGSGLGNAMRMSF